MTQVVLIHYGEILSYTEPMILYYDSWWTNDCNSQVNSHGNHPFFPQQSVRHKGYVNTSLIYDA